MELMIVIVIIGILSAVGMVMFGGQSEKAKIAVTKSNHKMVVKKMAVVLLECNSSETILLGSAEYSCHNAQVSWCRNFSKYFQNELEFKNPFNTKQKSVWCSKSYSMPRGFLLDNKIGNTNIVYSPDKNDKYLRVYSNLGRDEKGKFIILEDKVYNDNRIN